MKLQLLIVFFHDKRKKNRYFFSGSVIINFYKLKQINILACRLGKKNKNKLLSVRITPYIRSLNT